jgi:hypothetical protein
MPMELAIECPITVTFVFINGVFLASGSAPELLSTFSRVEGTLVNYSGGSLVVRGVISSPVLLTLATTTEPISVNLTITGDFVTRSSCGEDHLVNHATPWTFTFDLAPLRPVLALRQAVATTSAVSGAVSSAIGSPTVALQQGVLMSFSDLAACRYSDVEPLEASANPIGGTKGPELGGYYRGAVTAFCICLLCVPLGLGSFVALIYFIMLRKTKKQKGPGQNGDEICADAVAATSQVLFRKACGKLHFPSVLFAPFCVLAQGALQSAVSLLRLRLSSMDVFTALVTVFSCVFALAVTFLATSRTHWFKCSLGPRRKEGYLPFETNRHWQRMMSFVEGEVEWVEDTGGKNFKKRFMVFFDSFKDQWYAVVDLGLMLFQAVLVGVRSNNISSCRAQSVALLVGHVAVLLITAVQRPCLKPADNVFLMMNRLITTACAAATVHSVVLLSEESFGLVDQLSAAGSLISSVQTVLMILLFVLGICRRIFRYSEKKKKKSSENSVTGAPAQLLRDLDWGHEDDTEMPLLQLDLGAAVEDEPDLLPTATGSGFGAGDADVPPELPNDEEDEDMKDPDYDSIDELISLQRDIDDEVFAVRLQETELVDTSESLLFMKLRSEGPQGKHDAKSRKNRGKRPREGKREDTLAAVIAVAPEDAVASAVDKTGTPAEVEGAKDEA